jgi:hypothetical protein
MPRAKPMKLKSSYFDTTNFVGSKTPTLVVRCEQKFGKKSKNDTSIPNCKTILSPIV